MPDASAPFASSFLTSCSPNAQVTNGKNAMPAFGGRLSDEEIQDVAAFVFNQADTGAWDSR